MKYIYTILILACVYGAVVVTSGCDSSFLRGVGDGLITAGNVIHDTGDSVKRNS